MTPDGWRALRLGDAVSFEYGKSLPSSQRRGGSVPVCGSNGVVGYHDESLVRGPGIVVGRKGSVGAVAWMGCDFWPIDTTYYVNLTNQTDARWLYYALSNLGLEKLNEATGTPGLNRSTATSLRFQLPPIFEQRKIAAILASVDDTIEKTQAVIDQVQVVKRGLVQKLLKRGLPGRHSRFKQTKMGEVPEEWEIIRIMDVADVDYGISAAVSANVDPNIGWPILTGANLTLDGKIDLFKLVYHEPPSKERFLLRKDDLLLNWRSGSPRHVGKTALFDLDGDYTYASFVLRIRSRGKLVPGFGHVLLNFMRSAEFFSKDLSQQVNFKMNAAVFREILIRLPSVEEQQEIAQTVARFDSRLASEAQSLAALQNVKRALLSVLLTGELRVTPDPEDE